MLNVIFLTLHDNNSQSDSFYYTEWKGFTFIIIMIINS